jgi:farnesol dehydrogenase
MRILLTGGTGFLGRAVARALAGRGHDLVRFSRTACRSGLGGPAIDGDVRDASALARAADGCDAMVHAAALVSIWRRRRQDFDDVNVGGLRNALTAAAAARMKRIVYTSSFLALPPRGRAEPIEANDYQRTKVAADRLAEQAVRDGAPLVRLYPGVVYGPGTFTEGNLLGRLIADHMKHRLPALVGPENPWSFAYVEDVAAGHCAAV